MFTINTKQATAEIRAEFRDLSDDNVRLGIARAINHTIKKGKTASSKAIRRVYAAQAKYVNRALSLRKSTRVTLTGEIIAASKPLPLMAFRPYQRKAGVSVTIKRGRRKLVPGAFIQTMPSGHRGVFARGKYGPRNFIFRKKRLRPYPEHDLPITELNTLSVPKAYQQASVARIVRGQINTDYTGRLLHELKRLAR